MPIAHDHHIHTVYSGHSTPDMVVGAIVKKADRVGLKRIVILEHVPEMPRYTRRVADGELHEVPSPQINTIHEEIKIWRSQTPVVLLLGAEIDANPNQRDGRLLLSDLTDIDVVVASTHFLPGVPAMWHEVAGLPEEQLAKIYEAWMVWAMHVAANPEVDVLAHPGAEMAAIGATKQYEGRVLADFEKLLMICQHHGTAYEINQSLDGKIPREFLASYLKVLRRGKEIGVKFSLGSDAHSLNRLGNTPWVEMVVQELQLTARDYFHPTAGKRRRAEG